MPRITEYSSHFQPEHAIIEKLVEEVMSNNWNEIDIPVAYASWSGIKLLQDELGNEVSWQRIEKRFLAGIDWFRSNPIALDTLSSLPNSAVRIFDGRRLVDRKKPCYPFKSYHPKAFIFKKNTEARVESIGVLAGSGNLSWNGLKKGCELDLWVQNTLVDNPRDCQPLQNVCTWFSNMWSDSTPYVQIKSKYRDLYDNNKKDSKKTAITEDDSFPEVSSRYRGLSPQDLNVLRSFDSFWINTGSMYSNLGRDTSGNQLDMKRFTRVFFGFPAENLAKNTAIGSIEISYNGYLHRDRHLRFGDNEMDKLDLPVPGTNSPNSYVNKVLVFSRRVTPAGIVFNMQCNPNPSRKLYRSSSRRVNGLFKFGSGSKREFGVFR